VEPSQGILLAPLPVTPSDYLCNGDGGPQAEFVEKAKTCGTEVTVGRDAREREKGPMSHQTKEVSVKRGENR